MDPAAVKGGAEGGRRAETEVSVPSLAGSSGALFALC
jgi:hypothetical protein